MELSELRDGIVYTETIVHSPPEQFAADAPCEKAAPRKSAQASEAANDDSRMT